MNTKKTMRKSTVTENNGHNGQPGYLGKLKLLHHDHELPIRVLNACQIRRRNADPATVSKYAEMLSETEPPNIIVILDGSGRHYIADGHNRTAAALSAGRSVVKADVYSGAVSDAKIIGLQANQHGLALSLAERKSALDELLDTDEHAFTDSELARMTGLDRHTVERRRRERQSGDFIAAAGKMRRIKTPEEMIAQAATVFVNQVEKYGAEVVLKALEMLPVHIREDAMRQFACEETAQ
jgi:ParB-like chromosome segregation protein Spo0J